MNNLIFNSQKILLIIPLEPWPGSKILLPGNRISHLPDWSRFLQAVKNDDLSSLRIAVQLNCGFHQTVAPPPSLPSQQTNCFSRFYLSLFSVIGDIINWLGMFTNTLLTLIGLVCGVMRFQWSGCLNERGVWTKRVSLLDSTWLYFYIGHAFICTVQMYFKQYS